MKAFKLLIPGAALAAVVMIALSSPLAGCASPGGVPGLAAAAERADTDAALLYVAIATSANEIEHVSPAKTDAAEALKRKAWAARQVVRQAYALGQVADLAGLTDLLKQIGKLKGTP